MLSLKVFCSICIVNSLMSPIIVFLPSNYAKSGMYWSALIMFTLSLLSTILSIMLIEIHCKTQQILAAKDSGLDLNINFRSIFSPPMPIPCPELEIIKETRLETIQCVFILFGNRVGFIITLLALNVFLFILTQSYITFGSTMSSVVTFKVFSSCQIMQEDLGFTECRGFYMSLLLAFLVFQFCYLRKGIVLQEKLQMFCSGYAVSVVCLTVVACCHTMIAQSSYSEHVYREIPDLSNYEFGKTTKILSVSCMFLLIQPQIATLFQHLNKPEGFVRLLVCNTMAVLSLAIALCISVNLASDKVHKNFIENFINYSGGNNIESRPLYSFLLSYALRLLPAVLSTSTASIVGFSALSNFQNLLHSFNLSSPKYQGFILGFFTIVPFFIASFSPNLDSLVVINGILILFIGFIVIPVGHALVRTVTCSNTKFDLNISSRFVNLSISLLGIGMTSYLSFKFIHCYLT